MVRKEGLEPTENAAVPVAFRPRASRDERLAAAGPGCEDRLCVATL